MAKNKDLFASTLAFQLVGLSLIFLGCLVRVLDPYPVQVSRLIYFDALQRLAPREFNPDLPVRVVDVDEASLSELGQWPWPRTQLADMVERLGNYGAATIAFDMLFVEPDRYSPSLLMQDPAFAALLREDSDVSQLDNDARFGAEMLNWPVVLGVAARLTGEKEQVLSPAGIIEIGERPSAGLFEVPQWTPLPPPLDETATGIGGVNVSPLGGLGVVRRVPVLWAGPDGVMPSLGLEALRVATGDPNILAEGAPDEEGIVTAVEVGGFRIPTTENGEVWVRFRHDHPGLYISAKDVMADTYDPDLQAEIEGRIILVGTSAAGLFDIRETALGESVPGVSVHAQIVEQIILGDMLRRSDVTAAMEILAFISLGMIVTAVMSRFGAIASFVAGGVAAVAVVGISWAAFTDNSVLFDATFPLMGGMTNFGLLVAYLFISTEREKRAIRKVFSHYVAPEILDEMEASGHKLKLGGESQEITVMFSDIRGFTPLSESISPTGLVALLNDLFSQIGDQILEEKGTIDKFIGDAVMAFWNAPLPVEDHPLRAASAALLMRQALAEFNNTPQMRDKPPIALATGCATGNACVGNIGSRSRFNYTVIGDVVNVAARIEQNCRHVEYDILASEAVFEAAGSRLAMLEAGFIALKGKAVPEPVYIVVGSQDVAQSAEFLQLSQAHSDLITAIRQRQPQSVIERMCDACLETAVKLEPGLATFYRALSQRTADFRTDTQPGQFLFSHHEFSRKAGA